MSEAERIADEIIEKFTKGIKEKAVITNPIRFAAKKCALIHVEGIIEVVNDFENCEYCNSVDWQEVKTIIEKQITNKLN